MFPRTTVGGVSMPRMLIGTNWLLGWSHTSDAADRQIREKFSTKEAFLPVLETYLDEGIDAIMGPVSTQPLCLEAIRYAEDRLGKKLIIIDTPGMNVDDSAEARAEAKAVIKHSAEIGSTFCLIHHTSVEQLLGRGKNHHVLEGVQSTGPRPMRRRNRRINDLLARPVIELPVCDTGDFGRDGPPVASRGILVVGETEQFALNGVLVQIISIFKTYMQVQSAGLIHDRRLPCR